MSLFVDFATAAGASVTSIAAVGVYREARAFRRTLDRTVTRSREADRRSVGNRRYARRLGRLLFDTCEYEDPDEYDPDPEQAVATDGGKNA